MSSPAPSTDPLREAARPPGPCGVVFDIERFAIHDGPGIRTAVFLKGCALRCPWCHNPESWNPAPEWMAGAPGEPPERVGRERAAAEVLAEVLRDKPFFDASGGGLTLTGGEPLLQPGFAAALARGAKEAGLHVAVETAGAAPREALLALAPFTDLWLFDSKCLDPARHRALVGGDLAPSLANLEALDSFGAAVILRRVAVPGVTDDPAGLAALGALAERLPSVRAVEILPCHRLGEGKAARLGLPSPSLPAPLPDHAIRAAAAVAAHTHKPVLPRYAAPAGPPRTDSRSISRRGPKTPSPRT